MILPAFLIPAGSSALAALSFIFKFVLFQVLAKLAFFAFITIAAFFITDALLPPWFSVSHLQSVIQFNYPPINYLLEVTAFYGGFPLLLSALISAWVLKKIPASAWLGSIFRVVK